MTRHQPPKPTARDWMDAARIAKAWGSETRVHEFVEKAKQAHRAERIHLSPTGTKKPCKPEP